MTGRFKGISDFANSFKGIQIPEMEPSSISLPDKRTRAEYREDFEKELALLDKEELIKLKKIIIEINSRTKNPENDFYFHKNEIENSLIKFIRYIDEFEELNSEESRKLFLKRQELKLEAKHDWAEKYRLFFFRVLASMLFISTLFAIGYIEKEYDWATLPLSKYVKPPTIIK